MLVVGLTSEGVRPNDESEGHDRTSLLLPDNQSDYIEAVATAAAEMKIPVTVVVMGGGPVDISAAKSSPHVGAIMWCGCTFQPSHSILEPSCGWCIVWIWPILGLDCCLV